MKQSRKKLHRLFTVAALALFLLSGCGNHSINTTEPSCRVITGVTVTYRNGNLSAEKYYTASDKMRAILNYLRWIDPYGPPEEDPETAIGSSFHITLQYSDGCQKDYLQKADRYMQIDGGSWKKIDPQKAITLSQILGQMESDLIL